MSLTDEDRADIRASILITLADDGPAGISELAEAFAIVAPSPVLAVSKEMRQLLGEGKVMKVGRKYALCDHSKAIDLLDGARVCTRCEAVLQVIPVEAS